MAFQPDFVLTPNNAKKISEALKKTLEVADREDTADYMAELLMDETTTTWKMYEELACAYLNAKTDEYRNGLNDAVILLTGWSLDTISENIQKRCA